MLLKSFRYYFKGPTPVECLALKALLFKYSMIYWASKRPYILSLSSAHLRENCQRHEVCASKQIIFNLNIIENHARSSCSPDTRGIRGLFKNTSRHLSCHCISKIISANTLLGTYDGSGRQLGGSLRGINTGASKKSAPRALSYDSNWPL